MVDLELLRRIQAVAATIDQEPFQQLTDADDYDASTEDFEGTRPDADMTDDQVCALISIEARDFVIGFEVGSRKDYERVYHKPTWPRGASGVTIGIGYDLGYNSPEQVEQTWRGLISEDAIRRLQQACNVKGGGAKGLIAGLMDISIPWDVALEAYHRSTMPRFGRLVIRVFPNTNELHPHSFGALFSLVFNRGDSMIDKPGQKSRQQMRDIRDHMRDQKPDKVPADLRAMKQLWDSRTFAGLCARREQEAILFERGLELQKTKDAKFHESVEFADPNLDGDGQYFADAGGGAGNEETFEAVSVYDGVKWADDPESPDYRHLADRTLKGTTFNFAPQDLELLLRCNAFEPTRETSRVVFALRGAELVTDLLHPVRVTKQIDRSILTLRDARPNHRDFFCVIGVYDVTSQRMSGFMASTVPNPRAVLSYYDKHKSGNIMPTGCYSFEVGWHHASDLAKRIPGCLVENGRQKAVLRTTNNLIYEVLDQWEDDRPHGDNVHPAKNDVSAKFSSYGCLVINGNYVVDGGDRAHGTHTGEWALFRDAMGFAKQGTGDHGKKVDVVLLTGLEAAIAADLRKRSLDTDHTEVEAKLTRLRQGSHGERVRRLQKELGMPVTGIFDHKVAKTLADRQFKDLKWRDGIYSPAMDLALEFKVFAPLSDIPVVASRESVSHHESTTTLADADKRLESVYYEIGLRATIAKRDPSALAVDELPYHESAFLELNMTDVTEYGHRVFRRIETSTYSLICGQDPSEVDVEDRKKIREMVMNAAKQGADKVRDALVWIIRCVQFIPKPLAELIADLMVKRVLQPAAEELQPFVQPKVEDTCRAWSVSLRERETKKPVVTPIPDDGAARTVLLAPTGISKIVAQLTEAAKADNQAAVKQSLRDLRNCMDAGAPLPFGDAYRVIDALCKSGALETHLLQGGPDANMFVSQASAILNKRPLDTITLDRTLGSLQDTLRNPGAVVDLVAAESLLLQLRAARAFDQIANLADKLLTRGNDTPSIRKLYAQALIDGGRIAAGEDILVAALAEPNLTADERDEMAGLLGRVHKQIYLDHVNAVGGESSIMRGRFATHLQESIRQYATAYKPEQPARNFWHGINVIALAKRAESDGIVLDPPVDANQLAQRMIEALEPQSSAPEDAWILGTIAQSYVALGKYDKAGEYFNAFAHHKKVDEFHLNGTIRQLEEVWRIKAGPDAAGRMLIALKAALGARENGFVTITSEERHELQKLETNVPGGEFIKLGLLRAIVEHGAGVAAIRNKNLTTIGTGFLVSSKDLVEEAADEELWLLTNAHVVYCPKSEIAPEVGAITPGEASVYFEDGQPTPVSYSLHADVIFYSAPNELDATVLRFKNKPPTIKALPLASKPNLEVQDLVEQRPGTPLAVVGHPLGGDLAISMLGTFLGTKGTLVDLGPRSATLKEPIFMHYRTPTEPGNSGSPVFETKNWTVVGLHHAGFDPTTGRDCLRGRPGKNLANEGIYIESIKAAIRLVRKSGGTRQSFWGRSGR